MTGESTVAVSRRIAAPVADIFAILADPKRHIEVDGSQMLRGAVTDAVVSGVGDVFVMKMYHPPVGDYQMHNLVVEYEPDRRIGWEPGSAGDESTAGDRWGHRWSYELEPDGPDATVVTHRYDCSQVPEQDRARMDGGRIWLESMTGSLQRLEKLVASGER
jgi:RNA polymerase sigma-70 factor, ECF subfamily